MTVQLFEGDCLDILPTLEANSVDSIITDPPYGLEFMGKGWDHGVPGVPFWEAALRVVKPGAALLAFGGTRTHHRLMCAIEDAGWEIRDCLMWLYGSGFPKSHDISKAIDKAAGAEREVVGTGIHGKGSYSQGMSRRTGFRPYKAGLPSENNGGQHDITAPTTDAAQLWDGWGTALKPAYEPIILAMKPRDGTFANNALEHGVAGIWVDGCRVGTNGETWSYPNGPGGVYSHTYQAENGHAKDWNNFSTVQDNQPSQGHPSGRWPANLLLDEHAAAMLDEQSGESVSRQGTPRKGHNGNGWGMTATGAEYADTGGASRFFYCAKASRKERNAGLGERAPRKVNDGRQAPIDNPYQRGETPRLNTHPTVKPLELMRWLCRLTKTPTGGVVLDPFTGSGSTGIAAVLEGRDFIGIEIERESFEIAEARIAKAQSEMVQTRMTV